jgi:hypothetical protein
MNKKILALGIALIAIGFAIPYCHGADTNKPVIKLEQAKAPRLFVEGVGAIRYDDLKGPATYGGGADLGYAFNKYVIGHARVLTYETDNWRGTAVDEGSLLAEAKLLSSANGKLSLSGIGGVHRDFDRDDWGFGIGARGTAVVYKTLSAFAQGEIRAWFSKEKDGLVSAGLQWAF